MNLFILLWTFLWVPQIAAGITYKKNNDESLKSHSEFDKTVDEVKKATSGHDLSDITTRIVVEGARFRSFNLHLVFTKITSKKTIDNKLGNDIQQIIMRDLNIVGGFNFVVLQTLAHGDENALLKQKGAEGVSRVTFNFQNDIIKAAVEHKNLITGKRSFKSFLADHKGVRKLAHLLAQSIYEEFIGPENLFLLQIAAIKYDASGIQQVVLLDFDGYNERYITQGPWSKALPYFSCDGKSILYTVTYREGQRIVEQDISSKRIQFRTNKPGLNIEPRVLPDNSGLLVVLSFENSTNIYQTSRTGTILGKMTSSIGSNLSPSIRPDGKEFVFVSDRAGTPQLYVQELTMDHKTKPVERLTYQGKYNQTPHFSPDGKYIAFTGRDEKKVFDIFLLRRSDKSISRITENQGRNQEPHITPSGRFVIFVSEREKKRSSIFIATLDGKHQYRLNDASSSQSLGYLTPVVSPRPGLAE
jgi:TolB protein